MLLKSFFKICCLLVPAMNLLVTQGCTCRAWYDGFNERERQECYKRPNHDDIQACLDQLNNMSHDQYKKAIDRE